jgi:hypothetical protein
MTELQARLISVVICLVAIILGVIVASWGMTPYILTEVFFITVATVTFLIAGGYEP